MPLHFHPIPTFGSRARVAATAALVLLAGAQAVAAHELPVGDGKLSSQPRVGHVMACETQFRTNGARHVGDWFHGETWNPLEKPHVAGRIMWPQAAHSIEATPDSLRVEGNGLPVGQPTGIFPIAHDDPVHVYDTNPNPISAHALAFEIPLRPRVAAEPGCLPMGMIGVSTTGVALYNALDAAGRDAAAHEVQDLCDGHPQGQGQYHYHSASPCLPGVRANALLGWALDGYPVFGMRDASGAILTNADLDACHGRAEQVTIDGRRYDYVYRATEEYPYLLACFHGELRPDTRTSIRQSLGPPRRRPPR